MSAELDRNMLAQMIDHTLLKASAGPVDIQMLCQEALHWSFASVCVNPVWVPLASALLEDGPVKVCTVAGFPLGATRAKQWETARAVAEGAREIDMVIPVGHLKAGDTVTVERHIREVVEAAAGLTVKVILETCFLSDSEKRTACSIAENAGAGWVKTSTGFGSGGATAHDVRLLVDAVGGRLGVKASGGIRTLKDALTMVEAGATRLGCSRSVDIMNSWK